MNKKFKYKKLFLVVILSVILLVGCDGGGFGFFFDTSFVDFGMGYLILGGSQWVIGVICNGEFSDGFIFKFGEDVICVVGNMIIVIFNIQLEVVCSLCVVEKVLFSFEDV